MKVKDHPMVKHGLVKDFEACTLTPFAELNEEQKEYEIVATTVKTVRGDKTRVYVIASPEMMKQFNLKPKKFRATAMELFLNGK